MPFQRMAAVSCCAIAFFSGAAVLGAPAPVPVPDTSLTGTFREWHVYDAGNGADRSCFLVSPPQQMLPAGANRGAVFFMITSWPGRNVKNQPSIVPGYPYKEMSAVSVQIGADKFDFFTQNDGNTGGAWMETAEDEQKLIASMRRGMNMVVSGTSARGTVTKDTYSLAGISAALEKLGADCK